ncbi:uncharacterized protein ATC70_013509 [Mucor velutinosus]|uniref:Uncharacterized protein n=1 Tax=Mucor velutinosus TaxID=708070 RepID=A0AAN7D6I9_9FUNG|nr:hypothetical protein ATC70_013509 [Mucor velutinosus]
MTNIYGSRKVSLYGKANIANTLILSKLWHVIRVVSLPQEVLKKIKSTIYQFVMSGLFPSLKADSFFLPRDQGGLGLIDIGAQQKSLQFRYLRVLLLGNHGRLPGFTYQLLTHALRLTNDVAHHALPLLFPSARYKNTLNGLYPFLSMFNAMDICSLHRDWDRHPTITTIMSLPPKIADPQLIYNSIMHFKLKHYYIYNYDLHITIYDLFATIMRTIWRHHYQQFYNLIPFNAIQVCRHIRTELLRLSNLRQLSH